MTDDSDSSVRFRENQKPANEYCSTIIFQKSQLNHAQLRKIHILKWYHQVSGIMLSVQFEGVAKIRSHLYHHHHRGDKETIVISDKI